MTKQAEDNEEQQDRQEARPEGLGHSESRIRVGERLSQARQAKALSIADASDRLKIRRTYLEALESGDWSLLPEEVYIMGFLRQYTALLGVDLSDEIETLRTGEYQLTKPFTMPDPPVAMNRTWAIVAGACFLLLLILFNVVGDGEKDQSPPSTSVESLPLETPASPESTAPAQAPASIEPGAGTSEAAPEASSPSEGAADSAKVVTPAFEPTKPAARATAESPAGETGPSAPTTSPSGTGHSFELTAVNDDVWLQLHTPDGSLLREALLRSGQSMHVTTDAEFLLLTAGNPLALSIRIDGQDVAKAGELGEKDKVLHDYRLPTNEPGTGN